MSAPEDRRAADDDGLGCARGCCAVAPVVALFWLLLLLAFRLVWN